MSDGPAAVIVNSTGDHIAEVKGASTAAVAADKALVVAVSPNNTVAVTDNGGSLTVDGSVSVSNFPAVQPVNDNGGSLTVDGTVSISGTVPISAASLPLPTGAATAALQTQPGVDIGDVTVNNAGGVAAVNIQDGGNSLTVDGTVTANAGTGPWPVTDNGGSLTTDTPQLPAALVSGRLDVVVGASLPAGTNNIGDVDVLSVPAPLSTTGGGTEATALRVTLANDSTGLVSVDDNGGSLTVDGSVSVSNFPAVQPVSDNGGSLTVDTPQLPAVLVGGRLDVVVGAALPAGTNNIGDVDVLSVPAPLSTTGGGTEATDLRVTVANDSTGVLSVDDNGASLTVDTPQLPPALVGSRLDTNVGAWLGSTAPTVGQKLMAASVPVVLASDQSTVVVAEQKSSTAAHTNVPSSITSVTLLAANAARRGATIYNDGNRNLFVKLGATASATSFMVKLDANGFLEVPFGYTGVIDGIWDVVNGSARVVEFT